jgi:hypothetical protein
MIAISYLFDQENNDTRNPSYSFKGWGSEPEDFISKPEAISDFVGKAEDSVDVRNKKLVTPGPTKVAIPRTIQFISGGKK